MTLISNPGQINNSGDVRALYLKVFSGEILAQFREVNVMRNRIRMRSIPYGKSSQFPVLGKGYATVHTPGTNMLDASGTTSKKSTDPTGSAVQLPVPFAMNERIIYIDNPLVAPTMISNLDEMLTQFEFRRDYVVELALALANTFDRTAIIALIDAARTRSANAQLVTGEPGGGYNGDGGCLGIGSTPTGGSITDALFAAAQRFNEIDVPQEGRCVLLPWQAVFALIKDPTLYFVGSAASATAAEYLRAVAGNMPASAIGSGTGFSNPNLQFGNANWAAGTIRSVAGFDIVPTNHIPQVDLSAGTSFYHTLSGSNQNVYDYDTSSGRATAGATQGIAFQSSAIGCLLQQDLVTESDYKIEYQATLFLAKMLSGFNTLRGAAAIELTSTLKTSGA